MPKTKSTCTQKAPKKVGRPTIYNPDIARAICRAVATSTIGIRKICAQNPGFPNPDTIFEWRYDYSDFSEQYAKAYQFRAWLLAEEIIEIADDGSGDYLPPDENGVQKFNYEHFQRSRLRVDTRKWVVAKLLPKTYGDRPDSDDTPVLPLQVNFGPVTTLRQKGNE